MGEYDIYGDKNIKIPSVYQKMSERGYLTEPNYLGIWGMHWMSVDKIFQYKYYEDEDIIENKTMIPFAHSGTGDYWFPMQGFIWMNLKQNHMR